LITLYLLQQGKQKEKGFDFFTENYTQEEKKQFFLKHLFKHTPVIS